MGRPQAWPRPPLSRLHRPLRQSELGLLPSAEKHSPVREYRRRSGNSVLEPPSGLGLRVQASPAPSAHFSPHEENRKGARVRRRVLRTRTVRESKWGGEGPSVWVAGVPLGRSRSPQKSPGHARGAEPPSLLRGGALVTRFLSCVWRASRCQARGGSAAAAVHRTALFWWS